MRTLIVLCILTGISIVNAQEKHTDAARQMIVKGLSDLTAYEMLKDLTTNIGSRLSGSAGYDKAVLWGKQQLERAGADSVWLEPVMIPKWVRGETERAWAKSGTTTVELTVCALGGSIGTGDNGVSAEVIEVRSFDELRALGAKVKGKIVFYNRPFDKTLVNTGAAYGGAVNQRSTGSIEAAKAGAVGVLVRSMTNAIDDEPHTGVMRYNDTVPKIPAAAVSTVDANMLSDMIRQRSVSVTLQLSAKIHPDVPSFNVVGEIRGRTHPDEVVLVGGHLDSWDKGTGAHDDGSGVVHSIEVIRLIKALNIRPERTIRAVLFANEENGDRGARAYAARKQNASDKHIMAIESDAGGFLPRGFGVTADSMKYEKIRNYASLLSLVGTEKITKGGGGVDIDPLKPFGTVLIGLSPESQRYFDYHHSHHDTIDKVHPRELELGAIAMAILSWAVCQDGF
jgi:hypothetical protein